LVEDSKKWSDLKMELDKRNFKMGEKELEDLFKISADEHNPFVN
jgi:hypothetical protein